jgi:hypothetical protein
MLQSALQIRLHSIDKSKVVYQIRLLIHVQLGIAEPIS